MPPNLSTNLTPPPSPQPLDPLWHPLPTPRGLGFGTGLNKPPPPPPRAPALQLFQTVSILIFDPHRARWARSVNAGLPTHSFLTVSCPVATETSQPHAPVPGLGTGACPLQLAQKRLISTMDTAGRPTSVHHLRTRSNLLYWEVC